jgi:hypothetical protein
MNAGSTGRRAAIAVILVCAVSAIAVGGYLVGHSNGEDLNAARSKGEAAGRIAGAKQGAKRGRVVGRPAGFKAGYETAYRKAFEDAGLDPPEDVKVPTQ